MWKISVYCPRNQTLIFHSIFPILRKASSRKPLKMLFKNLFSTDFIYFCNAYFFLDLLHLNHTFPWGEADSKHYTYNPPLFYFPSKFVRYTEFIGNIWSKVITWGFMVALNLFLQTSLLLLLPHPLYIAGVELNT